MTMKDSRSSRLMRCLPLLLALLLFAGFFARISMLAQLSRRSKQLSALDGEIRRMEKEISQQELMLHELHDLHRIAERAAALGMVNPTEDQLRVLER